MIADIIIGALGIFFVAFMIYRFIRPPKNGCCSKCSGNCGQCASCNKEKCSYCSDKDNSSSNDS